MLDQILDMLLSLPPELVLASVSGFLQVLGYTLYIRKQLAGDVEPNPATWLMFAYGTALLTALEIDIGAPLELLVLPIICAILSVLVAIICWRRGALKWPEPLADKIAFTADLILTISYLGAWYLQTYGSITQQEREVAVVIFLVCSNLTTFTAFSPLIREAYISPLMERSSAWIIWTCAYGTLGLLTFAEGGSMALLIYPLTNVLLHGSVAILVRPSRRRRHKR